MEKLCSKFGEDGSVNHVTILSSVAGHVKVVLCSVQCYALHWTDNSIGHCIAILIVILITEKLITTEFQFQFMIKKAEHFTFTRSSPCVRLLPEFEIWDPF